MDDTNQKTQNSAQLGQNNSVSQMADQTNQQNQSAGQTQQPVQPVAAPTPVSLPQKEQAPIISKDLEAELIKPSEPEPKIPQEVKDAGVEAVKETPHLTDEHKALGIEHAKESTPVLTAPLGKVKLPITEGEALNIIKTTKVSDSKHWFAVLIEKIYKQLRLMRGKI